METFRVRFCSTTDTLRLNKWPIDLKEPVDSFKMVVKEPFRSFSYTWFTMEALEDTWENLQKIIEVCRFYFVFFFSIKIQQVANAIILP